jgi:hypothetical protein
MTSARPVASVIAWPSAGKKVMSSMSDEKVTSTPEMPWPWLSLRVVTIPIRSDLLASTELGLTFSTSRPELLLFRMNCSSVLPLLPPPPPVLPQLTTTAASARATTPPVIHFRARIVVRPVPSQRRRLDGHRVTDLVRFESVAAVADRGDRHHDGHVEGHRR